MPTIVPADWSFRVISQLTTEIYYPLRSTPDGTSTAASSDFITTYPIELVGVLVEDGGSVAGTLTISDHAGTTTDDIEMALGTTDWLPIPFGANGIRTDWTGIRAKVTGTAVVLRVFFRAG